MICFCDYKGKPNQIEPNQIKVTFSPVLRYVEPCTHPSLQEGTILTADNAPYEAGDMVVLSCDEGLEPEGNTSLTCQADGTWDPTPGCSTSSDPLATWVIIGRIPLTLIHADVSNEFFRNVTKLVCSSFS